MICIHHDDLDGRMSAAIIVSEHPDCKCIEMSYKDVKDFDIENLKDEVVYMVDFSFPMEEMMEINNIAKFIWIDHHKTAIEDYDSCIKVGLRGIREIGSAACELTWNYLYENLVPSIIVKLAADYDVWRDHLDYWETEIMPFQMFARNKTVEELVVILNSNAEVGAINKGKAILDYDDDINAQDAKNCFELEWEGIKFICLNTQKRGSRIFKSVWDNNKYHAMLVYCYTGSDYRYSLYTDKDVDLSLIAKQFGGGGHAKACGFISDKLPWELLVSENK